MLNIIGSIFLNFCLKASQPKNVSPNRKGKGPLINNINVDKKLSQTEAICNPEKNPSHADLQCKGINDANIFAKVDKVCKDCCNLYGDEDVLRKCR